MKALFICPLCENVTACSRCCFNLRLFYCARIVLPRPRRRCQVCVRLRQVSCQKMNFGVQRANNASSIAEQQSSAVWLFLVSKSSLDGGRDGRRFAVQAATCVDGQRPIERTFRSGNGVVKEGVGFLSRTALLSTCGKNHPANFIFSRTRVLTSPPPNEQKSGLSLYVFGSRLILQRSVFRARINRQDRL